MKSATEDSPALRIRLLGPLTLWRNGQVLDLPPSRKARALLAYLALSSRPLSRSHLCELLWDLPADPRGELRGCLSRLRGLLDDDRHTRVLAQGDTVSLRLDGAEVDALAVRNAVPPDLAGLDTATLRDLAARFGPASDSELLQGLAIERSAPFSAWLVAQRRHFRATHAAVIGRLVQRLAPASDEAQQFLGEWLALAPFDRLAHTTLLDTLARRGNLREGDEHLRQAVLRFAAQGQDGVPIQRAWQEAKARHAQPPQAATPVAAVMPVAVPDPGAAPPAGARRASVAVMPFIDHSPNDRSGGLVHGLAFDIITRLAKLRSLFVIAPGTVFALHERHMSADEAARHLGVDYVVSGTLQLDGRALVVTVQLAETRSAHLLWVDEFAAPPDGALRVLDDIGERIVTTAAAQVELAERNRAILKPPGSLDAWEAHHRGLWHMYRFERADNELARQCFETAVRQDPGFARPWAGLSFTHFQNAFLGWGDREAEVERAYRTASQALMADDLDPSAHWALGRALWLRGQLDASMAELDTAVELSPNFAVGHYTRAFVHAQSGDPLTAIEASDHSRRLSPHDPLLFAMLASRAIALVRLGRCEEAADWAVKAIARPNAHVHILAIAAYCLALAGRLDEARQVSARIQQRQAGYRIGQLLGAFHYSEDATAQILSVARAVGLQ